MSRGRLLFRAFCMLFTDLSPPCSLIPTLRRAEVCSERPGVPWKDISQSLSPSPTLQCPISSTQCSVQPASGLYPRARLRCQQSLNPRPPSSSPRCGSCLWESSGGLLSPRMSSSLSEFSSLRFLCILAFWVLFLPLKAMV